jgi:hypothetical protein
MSIMQVSSTVYQLTRLGRQQVLICMLMPTVHLTPAFAALSVAHRVLY